MPTRLLLIEDNLEVQRVLYRLLTRSDYEVRLAATLLAAREILDEPWPADLIVTDLGLPDGSGATLAAQLAVTHPDLPVVVLSGEPAGDSALPPRTPLLLKPVSATVLIETLLHLRRAIHHSQRPPAPRSRVG